MNIWNLGGLVGYYSISSNFKPTLESINSSEMVNFSISQEIGQGVGDILFLALIQILADL